jgi:cell growth-regulating nucleolar protein
MMAKQSYSFSLFFLLRWLVGDSCNESLKKNKVAQHWQRCRNDTVTCIDCGVVFPGEEFEKHTSCVSEEEKYQGKLFKGKKTLPQANGNGNGAKAAPVTTTITETKKVEVTPTPVAAPVVATPVKEKDSKKKRKVDEVTATSEAGAGEKKSKR